MRGRTCARSGVRIDCERLIACYLLLVAVPVQKAGLRGRSWEDHRHAGAPWTVAGTTVVACLLPSWRDDLGMSSILDQRGRLGRAPHASSNSRWTGLGVATQRSEPDEIDNLGAWLSTVVARWFRGGFAFAASVGASRRRAVVGGPHKLGGTQFTDPGLITSSVCSPSAPRDCRSLWSTIFA